MRADDLIRMTDPAQGEKDRIVSWAALVRANVDDPCLPEWEAGLDAGRMLDTGCLILSRVFGATDARDFEHVDQGGCCECGGPHNCQDCPTFDYTPPPIVAELIPGTFPGGRLFPDCE